MANLTALAAARAWQAGGEIGERGLFGRAPLTICVSEEGHSCLDKSVDLLGLGRAQLRRIPVDENFQIHLPALDERIRADRSAGCQPICIVGNAGSVNTGAIDPLEALADRCTEHGLWFHVDGAYGAPAAGTDLVGDSFAGLARADSQGEDGRTDPIDYTLELSREFRALKVWMTFKAYGARALRSAIEDDIETMRHLARLIGESGDFELLAPHSLSVVCFRFRTPDQALHSDEAYLSRLNERLAAALESDGRVFLARTRIARRVVLRACCINFRTGRKHVERLLDVARELGERIHAEACSRCQQ